MALRIISIGSLSSKPLAALEDEYLTRLRPHLKVGILELPLGAGKSRESSKVIAEEGERILAALKEGEQLFALDEHGSALSSIEFSKMLERSLTRGNLSFVIGGAYGLADKVKQRADRVISLSPLTFTYQWARVLLVEQIYRANCTLRGVDYQK